MKTIRNLCVATVLGSAMTLPLLAGAVTLSSTKRTPCLFGALGSRTVCVPANNGTLRINQPVQAPARAPSLVSSSQSQSQPLPSTVVSGTPAAVATPAAAQLDVQAIPLPLGGALLLGSLALMIGVNRKKRD